MKSLYRIKRISKFDADFSDGTPEYKVVTMPSSYGLAIEKRDSDDDNTYIVIAFVKPSSNGETYKTEFIGERIREVKENEWKIVQTLIETAGRIVTLEQDIEL